MRGCLARGGVHGAKLRRITRTVLPRIQARVRGFLARQKYRRYLVMKLHEIKAIVIQRSFRQYILRRVCRKARRIMQIRFHEEAAALIFQKVDDNYNDNNTDDTNGI